MSRAATSRQGCENPELVWTKGALSAASGMLAAHSLAMVKPAGPICKCVARCEIVESACHGAIVGCVLALFARESRFTQAEGYTFDRPVGLQE